MKTIALADARGAGTAIADLAATLSAGGVVCVPLRGTYRLLAPVRAEAAIARVLQGKRRTDNRPSLVLVPSLAAAAEVVDGTAWPTTTRLARAFWPGPLTMVLPPSDQLSSKLRKTLSRANGGIGVRQSHDPLIGQIVAAAGTPLLATSANLAAKPGATSAAAIRQRLGASIDVWVDGGDTAPAEPSTVIAVTASGWSLVRGGVIAEAELAKVVAPGP
jgi:L-threonylcarbamoyladenylate synthase